MKTYTCRFCGRVFHNSQALGGHQNAHRKERDEAKNQSQEMRIMMMMMASTPWAFIEHQGVLAPEPHQITVAQPIFPWTCFSSATSLAASCSTTTSMMNYCWPGSFRVGEGAETFPAPQTSITTHNFFQDDGAAKKLDDSHDNDDHQRQFGLPDLNLDAPPHL